MTVLKMGMCYLVAFWEAREMVLFCMLVAGWWGGGDSTVHLPTIKDSYIHLHASRARRYLTCSSPIISWNMGFYPSSFLSFCSFFFFVWKENWYKKGLAKLILFQNVKLKWSTLSLTCITFYFNNKSCRFLINYNVLVLWAYDTFCDWILGI